MAKVQGLWVILPKDLRLDCKGALQQRLRLWKALQVAKVDGHIVQLSHGEPQDGSKQTATPWHFAEQSGPPKCKGLEPTKAPQNALKMS